MELIEELKRLGWSKELLESVEKISQLVKAGEIKQDSFEEVSGPTSFGSGTIDVSNSEPSGINVILVK